MQPGGTSLRVLEALRARGRSTIAQLASITGANRNTLKVRLRERVADRRVRQHGKARATRYSLSAPPPIIDSAQRTGTFRERPRYLAVVPGADRKWQSEPGNSV